VTRILLCHQPIDGGVARHVGDLLEGLPTRGFEVVVCSPAMPTGVASVVTHTPLDLRREISPRADAAALAGLAGLIGELRPDIIHGHSSKAGALVRLARLRHPRARVVYTPHGYPFAGHFPGRSERLAYRAIERALAPLASRVVCVCEAEARLARSVGPRGRIRVVHNGIAPAPGGRIDPGIAELGRSGPVIGALAGLRPGKGLETLIEAAPRVLARHPGVTIAIVGDGPELPALRARAGALGVAQAVRFPGGSADPLAALRGMDLFAHPSWAEAFPYVVLEAMSLARPIVASDVGGVGEAVIDGESGLLVPPRDSDALARALIELLDDPARARRLGETAMGRIRSDFSREAMIDGVSAVYDELVPSSPRQAPTNGRPSETVQSSPSARAMKDHSMR
jgi:glycosyltransferase involved in cell wall biosynthesis